MDLRRRVEAGQSAERLLDDAAFSLSMGAVVERLQAQMIESTPGEEGREARECAHYQLVSIRDLMSQLKNSVLDGKIAQKKLDEELV